MTFFDRVDVDHQLRNLCTYDNNVQGLAGNQLRGDMDESAWCRVPGVSEGEMSYNPSPTLAILRDLFAAQEVQYSTEDLQGRAFGEFPRFGKEPAILHEGGDASVTPSRGRHLPGQYQEFNTGATKEETRTRSPRGQSQPMAFCAQYDVHQSFNEPSQARRDFVRVAHGCFRCGEVAHRRNNKFLCWCGTVMLRQPVSNMVRWLPRSEAFDRRGVPRSQQCVFPPQVIRPVPPQSGSERWLRGDGGYTSDNDEQSDLRSDVPTNRSLNYEGS